jgi:hypothetical protein
MFQKFTNSVAGAKNLCSAMETETIQKKGVSPKNHRSRINLTRGLLLLSLIFCGLTVHTQLFAQKKTVYVIPETAKIFYNGHEVGNGSYEIKFSRKEDFVMLKFEAPGYIPKTVKLFKNNPKKTVSYELFVDEAMQNSIGAGEGIDLANKFFTVTCKKGMTEDVVWKRLMNIVVTNFENAEVRDKAAGWIRTAWIKTFFLYQIVRTRLEIQVQFTGEEELAYKVRISSEIADKDCGSSDQCFIKYDRILRKYEQVISELQASLGGNI